MLKKLFYFYLFYLINSLKINNITHEYSEGVFKNAILKKGAEYFFANTADNLYKSSTLDGSKINSFSLNFSDNSSFIYVSELDIFVAACTKDFLLAIIDSSSKIHIIFKDNIIKDYSPVQKLIVENKCNLLYYFSNEDGEENFNLIFSIPLKEDIKFKYMFFKLNLNEYLNSHTTGDIIEFNNLKINKTQPTDVNFFVDNYFNYYPHSILFKNDNNFFSSFLKINSSSDNHIYNLIYCGENNLSFNFNNKFEFIDIYPIGAFKYNESGIFYGFDIENKNLYFLYPKFDLSGENHTYIDFSIDYKGVINNQIDYNTIKAAYINETHFILNYLYNENKLKIKIIDISNIEMEIGIFDFDLVLSDINPVKTYFNFILSYYKFSYLLSTENEKYYFIITNNKCDSSCRICFDSNEGINNKCVKCLNDDAFRLFEEMNNIEFQCFNECPIDYGYKTDKIEEHICYHKDEDLDGYFWDGDNFSPCLNNKCLKCKNNDKCLVCSIDFPYKLFEDLNNNEFECYDKCPVDYGYKTDKKEEKICYNKDEEMDGYYWDDDNFSSCPKNCTKCINNDKCLECSYDFPYKLFEEINNNEFKCFDKCPSGYESNKNDHICYSENPCYLELNQIKSFIPNFITYYINQSIQCENYIIQCFYYSKENIEKFYNKNKLSSKIYLDFNKLRLLSENKYIFFKLDIIRKDELLNQIEYKLYDENKNEVNLNNTQIQISIPVSAKKDLNEQLIDEYKLFTNETLVWNSSSPFYNDICYTFSENKKDVILEDRKKNYFPYDKVLDENCEFVSIKDDVINLLCDYKENIITENRNYTSNKIHEEFNISRTNENFKILKCPKNKFYKSYIFWICFILSIFQVIFFLYICKYVIFAEEKEENELQSEKNDDLKNININIVKEFDLENDENNENNENNGKKKLEKKNSKKNKNGINLVLKKQITLEGNDNNKDDDDNDSNFIKDNKGKGISHFNMNTGGGLKLKVNKNNNIYHNNNDLIESSNNSNVEEEEENHENSSDNKNSNGLSLKIIDDSKNDNSNMDVLSDKSKKEFSNRAYSNFINDEEFKYMNYNDQINEEEDENDKKNGNKFCDIYGHYLKYNELTLFTFFNKNDFNHKYLKLSLFVFYLCCIILFNIFLFSNDIFSKIYNKNKYPFADCLGNNFIVILVCYAISFGAKFFISTQHDIINSIKDEKYNVEMPENNEQNKDEIKEVSNNFNNSLFIYEKKIKNDKKKLIDFELKKNKCWVIAYFGGVIVTYVYTFIHTISFGIIFNNSQKFIVLNLFICYLVGIIFSLMFNLVSTLLRFFGVKKKSEKLFNLSFWTTITIY
jgi:hypothetical protein